jgi:hypothetical protein
MITKQLRFSAFIVWTQSCFFNLFVGTWWNPRGPTRAGSFETLPTTVPCLTASGPTWPLANNPAQQGDPNQATGPYCQPGKANKTQPGNWARPPSRQPNQFTPGGSQGRSPWGILLGDSLGDPLGRDPLNRCRQGYHALHSGGKVEQGFAIQGCPSMKP